MTTVADAAPARRALVGAMGGVPLVLEYWTVTMDGEQSCGSCDDTLAIVNAAVDIVRPLAERLDLAIDLVSSSVSTWADAVGHGIVASPTLRAAGLELRPSHHGESETRYWRWRGTTSGTVNPDSVIDFLVRALAARGAQLDEYLASGGPAPFVRQFLRATPFLDAAPTADVPKSGSCGCGPSTES